MDFEEIKELKKINKKLDEAMYIAYSSNDDNVHYAGNIIQEVIKKIKKIIPKSITDL